MGGRYLSTKISVKHSESIRVELGQTLAHTQSPSSAPPRSSSSPSYTLTRRPTPTTSTPHYNDPAQ